MKTKVCMLILMLGMFFAMPLTSYSMENGVNARITDEELDYQGGNHSEVGPVSLDPVLVQGILSRSNMTIKNTFCFDFGTVTVQVVDENRNAYIIEQINTSADRNMTLDISSLPQGDYTIICYIEGELPQEAAFTL